MSVVGPGGLGPTSPTTVGLVGTREDSSPVVVGLHGQPVHDLPERSELLVAELRDLLTRAESGEIISIVYAAAERNGKTTIAGFFGCMGAALLGRGYSVLNQLARQLEGEGEE